MSFKCEKLQALLNEYYSNVQTDYLKDYPYLTLQGRMAGLSDDKIIEMNEKIVNDKELLMKIYKELLIKIYEIEEVE